MADAIVVPAVVDDSSSESGRNGNVRLNWGKWCSLYNRIWLKILRVITKYITAIYEVWNQIKVPKTLRLKIKFS